MEIRIGTKIRELRRQRGLTQEELAARLNISSQAVSKWENDTCYPDITQIPALAGFFGVSLDTLFCYDAAQLNARIDDVIQKAKRYFWSSRDTCEDIYLSALKEYPDNERLRAELLDLYISRGCKTKSNEELIDFAKQLAADTKDIFLQFRAKDALVSLHLRENRYNEAKAIIETLPVVYPYMLADKMRLSAYLLKGEDRLTWAKEWKIIEIQELYIACLQEGTGYFEIGQYEEALVSFGQYRRTLELFMKSDEICLDSYLWGGMQTHHWCAYLREAGCLAKLGRTDEAKAKLYRAYEILTHAWREKDGSADYFAKEPETYLAPFRSYYSEWGADELGPCPW